MTKTPEPNSRDYRDRATVRDVLQEVSLGDLQSLFHIILTYPTAGPGLGLNDAELLLIRRNGRFFPYSSTDQQPHAVVIGAVGPVDPTEAGEIWKNIGYTTLREYLKDPLGKRHRDPLMGQLVKSAIHLAESETLEKAVKDRTPVPVTLGSIPRGDAYFEMLYRKLGKLYMDSRQSYVVVYLHHTDPRGTDHELGFLVAADFNGLARDEETIRQLHAFSRDASVYLYCNLEAANRSWSQRNPLLERIAQIDEKQQAVVAEVKKLDRRMTSR